MNLADKAYDLIRRDIITCVLQPGQQIAQAQLAEKYDVGMTPVREALQRLAHENLVSPVPRSGYVVSSITFSDIRELFELRSILETAAVRLAAVRASEEQLRHIYEKANFKYVYNDREDYTRFLARNADFHCSIAALSGNQRLTDSLSRILDELTRVFHLGLDLKDSAEEMREEHLGLAKALLARDDDLAVKLVHAQIFRSSERIVEAVMSRVHTGLTGSTPPQTPIHLDTVFFGEK